MGGLNNRLGSLGLDDLRGLFGFAYDDASWITSFYSAGELAVMPFVAWLVFVFSFRRVHVFMCCAAMLLALMLPLVHNVELLCVIRFVQGVACGALIFMYMISLFLMLPAHVRMYGFGFYAMVSTFAPNFGVWLTAVWTDMLHEWEFLYWTSLLLGIPAMLLVLYGIPAMQPNPAKAKNINIVGMLSVIPGTVLVALALTQGVRLDWFKSPFVTWSLFAGLLLIVVYVVTDWNHPNPFLQLRIFISHRNVWMVLLILVGILFLSLAGAMLPLNFLGQVWGYRPLQSAPTAMVIAMPQFVVGPAVAWLLYRKWIDTRSVYMASLLLVAAGCVICSRLDAEWTGQNFYLTQAIFAFGLPTAMVSGIFMASNNINPMLGPSFGGAINTVRCIGTLAGTAVIGQYMHVRQAFHHGWLRDRTSEYAAANVFSAQPDLSQTVSSQAFIQASSDTYCLLAVIAVAMALIVPFMRYTPPPQPPAKTQPAPGKP